jgi:DNA-binding winged helix-turn-helix (wHTH) protein/TolB-like protein
MSMRPGWIFQFGEFQLDVRARSLRREKAIVALNSRAFDVLLYFVQNPGKVLTHEELLKNVWAESFVDENSLAQSISALRRALEEKPGDNNFIVTLPGRGYQFVSPVQVIAAEGGSTLPELATAAGRGAGGLLFQKHTIQTSVITTNEEKEQLSLPISRSLAFGRLVTVLAVVAASLAGVYAWKQFHEAPPLTHPPAISSNGAHLQVRRSIAVLGFRNLSGRPEEGWLSTALAEMLSTELEAGEELRLVSGEDIARTKLELPLADADSLSRDTLTRLHKDLDSDLIVLGSYTALGEKSGTRIRLDLRLQDTAAGETIADIAVVGSEADLI